MNHKITLVSSLIIIAVSFAGAQAGPTSPMHAPVPPAPSSAPNVAPADSSGYYDNEHDWHFWRTHRNTASQNEPALVYNDSRYPEGYAR